MENLLIVGIVIAAIAVIILLAFIGKFLSSSASGSRPCSPGRT